MSGLEKFTRSSSLSTPSSQDAPSFNMQQESSEYVGNTIKVWNDFPLLKNIGSDHTISQVGEPTTIRRQGTLYFQKRFAWASFKKVIHVVTILRPLTRQEDNKLKPSGEWFIENHDTYTPTSAPKIRKGVLKNSYASNKKNNSTNETADSSSSSAPQTEAEYAVSLLPTELQKHILHMKRKGSKVFSAGSSGISDDQGRLLEENVRLLLITGDTALVIHANRKNLLGRKDTVETAVLLMNKQDWTVNQYTYPITPLRTAVEGKKRQGIES